MIQDPPTPLMPEADPTPPEARRVASSGAPHRAHTILGRLSLAVREQNWFAVVLEVLIVIVGVVIGFQVTAWGNARAERAVAAQYTAGFVQDLRHDLDMLASNIAARDAQVRAAHTALAFFEGRELDVDTFFTAYYTVLASEGIAPNRNTMDEVLNSGSLRLLDDSTRSALLDLYASYENIANSEAHLTRDYEVYLYDETFSSIPFQYQGPWAGSPDARPAAERLLSNLTVENGLRLVLANVGDPNWGLAARLRSVHSRVERLLGLLEGAP